MVIKIISVIRRCLKRNILLKNQEELYRKNLGERIKLKQFFLSSGITYRTFPKREFL